MNCIIIITNLKYMFCLSLLHLSVSPSLCRIMYLQSLLLETCFHFLLQEKQKVHLRARMYKHDFVNHKQPTAVQYATYTSVSETRMWNLKPPVHVH